jgi:hypothetical protein
MATPGSPATDNANKVTLGEFIGRDVKFVNCALTGIHTGYTAADSNLAKVTRVLSKFCTVTVVGTPAGDNVKFLVEGLPSGSVKDYTGTSAAIATALATDADAATSGSTTWTITDGLSGTTFA